MADGLEGDDEWIPINSGDDLFRIYHDGNYYLTNTIALGETWCPTTGLKITLDLNGQTIRWPSLLHFDDPLIKVYNGSDLTIIDRRGGGKISGGQKSNRGGAVFVSGNFTLAGGNITDNVAYKSENNGDGGGVYVNVGGNFTLAGGNITGNRADDYGGGVYVASMGTFTMVSGTISGNTAMYGGGVFVDDNGGRYAKGGTLVIMGGTISDNVAYDMGGGVCAESAIKLTGGTISNNTAQNGGGVYAEDNITLASSTISDNKATTNGGGVYVTGGIFTKSGENVIENNSATNGGGVYVTGGTFETTGGNIIGNTAHDYGGGVYVDNSNFISSDGNVSENIADFGGGVYAKGSTFTQMGGNITDNTAQNGGGVCVSDVSNFRQSGGNVIDNSADDYGGGVYVSYGGSFTQESGTITGNTASERGGGVYVLGDFIQMNGNVINNTAGINGGGIYFDGSEYIISGGRVRNNIANDVLNNVYLPSGRVINIGVTLTGDRMVGITTGTLPKLGTPTTFTNETNIANAKFFIPDDKNYNIVAIDGKLVLAEGGIIDKLPTTSGNYYMTKDISIDETWTIPEGQTILLDLDGYNITMDGSSEVIRVEQTADLIITDTSTGEHGKITGGNNINDGGGVYVEGSFTLDGGNITGNKGKDGGGVYVSHGGIFTQIRGNVDYNTATDDGGGIYAVGNFIKKNGDVNGNIASGYGGGIYVNGKHTHMSGNVSGNSAIYGGGGIYYYGSDFVLSGGRINNNTVGNNTNNVYVHSDTEINIVGTPHGEEMVGITTETTPALYNPTIFTNETNAANAKYFFPDNKSYSIVKEGEKLALALGGITDELPIKSGIFYLLNNITINNTWTIPEGQTILLDLKGFDITMNGSNQRVINIASESDLTITNTNPNREGKITGGNGVDSGAGVYASGNFTLAGGNITGNNATNSGGGVFVGSSSTFTQTSGNVNHNNAMFGGGVSVTGNFIQMGGNVTCNNATSDGGGVYFYGYEYLMSGGNVNNNTANGVLSNVHLSDDKIINIAGRLTGEKMVGITAKFPYTLETPRVVTNETDAANAKFFFTDNPAESIVYVDGKLALIMYKLPTESGEYSLQEDVEISKTWEIPNGQNITLDLNGHDIRMISYNGVINVTSGANLTITDTNTTKTGKITGGKGVEKGAGVYVHGDFTLAGGNITGNTANTGGGVYVSNDGTFTMSCDATIDATNEVYLCNGRVITVNGDTFTGKVMRINGESLTDDTPVVEIADDSIIRVENIINQFKPKDSSKTLVVGDDGKSLVVSGNYPPKIAYATLSLGNDIAVRFIVLNSSLVGYHDANLSVAFNGTSYTLKPVGDPANDWVVFTFKNISPAMMNETMIATLYATKDGEENALSLDTREYSVKTYCTNMLEKYKAKNNMTTLCVDLLNYGSQTQLYTGETNLKKLANYDLSSEQKKWVSNTVTPRNDFRIIKEGHEDVGKWNAAALNLYSDISIIFKFTPGNEIDTRNLKAVVTYGQYGNKTAEITKFSNAKYGESKVDYKSFKFDGMNALELNYPVQVKLVNIKDGRESNTIQYSVDTYCYSKLSSGELLLIWLVDSITKYTRSVATYVGGEVMV